MPLVKVNTNVKLNCQSALHVSVFVCLSPITPTVSLNVLRPSRRGRPFDGGSCLEGKAIQSEQP